MSGGIKPLVRDLLGLLNDTEPDPRRFSQRYFKRGSFFGLACFEKLDVENTSERGARMKSVGVLTRSYSLLHMYKVFLQKQVRLVEIRGFDIVFAEDVGLVRSSCK